MDNEKSLESQHNVANIDKIYKNDPAYASLVDKINLIQSQLDNLKSRFDKNY